jgi:acyl-CoA thioester hydrolase
MTAVDLSLFRFSCPIAIRYRDIDMQQHVNNAVTFTYLETARVSYLRQVMGWNGDWLAVGMILAHAEMDYRMPLLLGDDAHVHVRVARLGGKSFDFAYAVTRQPHPDETTGTPVLAATAHTVQVAYDYSSEKSIPIPAQWREQIIAYEPSLNTP